jgi:transposase, IS6 family
VKQNKSLFKWRHFEPAVILLCVRWYCCYQLSYRDLEEMMRERGLTVDHVTIFRSRAALRARNQQADAPHLKISGTSYRLD